MTTADTAGKPLKSRAAVAFAAGQRLQIVELGVAPRLPAGLWRDHGPDRDPGRKTRQGRAHHRHDRLGFGGDVLRVSVVRPETRYDEASLTNAHILLWPNF